MHLDMNVIRKLKFYRPMDDGTRVCTATCLSDQIQLGAWKGAVERGVWGFHTIYLIQGWQVFATGW